MCLRLSTETSEFENCLEFSGESESTLSMLWFFALTEDSPQPTASGEAPEHHFAW